MSGGPIRRSPLSRPASFPKFIGDREICSSDKVPVSKVAEMVLALLKEKRTALSSKEIAVELFGPEKGYQQRVDEALRNLVREGRVERFGCGGVRQPYSYQIKAASDDAQGE
jgi:hypothetical protein